MIGAPLETGLSSRVLCRKHRAGVDIHSCSQFLLELYSRWILPSGSARRTPIILISEVVRSVSLPPPLPLHTRTGLVTAHTQARVFARTRQYGHCTLTQSSRSLGTREGALGVSQMQGDPVAALQPVERPFPSFQSVAHRCPFRYGGSSAGASHRTTALKATLRSHVCLHKGLFLKCRVCQKRVVHTVPPPHPL